MAGARDREFEVFFRSEYASIVRAAFVLTGDRAAAEDVAQEAFARLYANWRKVSSYERPGAWVRRVAINLATSSLRRRRPIVEAARDFEDFPDPDLRSAIVRLPRGQRAAIVLHYLEDRSVAEIAQILECSESTVKVHLHRARTKLATALSEETVDA